MKSIEDLYLRIKKDVVLLSGDEHIDSVIRVMVNKKVSSAIILERDHDIAGIVTERDILRKIATLEFEEKYDKGIRTIMTQPVVFAYLDTLMDDLRSMHKKSRRHFPVLHNREDGPVKPNLIGILTVTDVFRHFLS